MLSVIQPPSSGPTTGATSVVIAHIASDSAMLPRTSAPPCRGAGDDRSASETTGSLAVALLIARPPKAVSFRRPLLFRRRSSPTGLDVTLALPHDRERHESRWAHSPQ